MRRLANAPSRLLASLVAIATLLAVDAAHAERRPARARVVEPASRARADERPPELASPRFPSLDPALQASAARVLARSRAPEGAIVVSDVRTGRILAWVSRGPVDHVKVPVAPSASLFKVVSAAALLESGRVDESSRMCFAGGGERAITPADLLEHPARDTACVRFGDVLGKSINVVVARAARKHLSREDLHAMAAALGVSGRVPIDVTVPESTVSIPEDDFGRARAAAGFWNGKLSALGALYMMHTIANGGERTRLSTERAPTRVVLHRAMRERTASALRRMLEVTTRRGTCAKAFREADGTPALGTIPVAAKTGTLIGGRPTRMYSWFAGFAPADAPEIAIAVLLADDVSWWMKANAAGRDVLKGYFAARQPTAR